jgi:CDP-diacylglycerol--serine O-phosphatidyltransferase
MNLFSGFNALIFISKDDYVVAAIFILVAAIFDALDGAMARLVKSTSEFGVELDSLCDAVSFGVVPSFMLYKVFFYQYSDIGILFSSLPALAGVVRLARFNVKLTSFEDKLYFTGMPIPAGALFIISYVIFYHIPNFIDYNTKVYLAFIVTILASLAMVSTVKFDNLPKPTKKSIKQRPIVFSLFIIALIGSIITKGKMIFPFLIFYVFASSIRHLIYWIKLKREATDDLDESDE